MPQAERLSSPQEVAALDEAFHTALVDAAGNPEVARCHRDVTERIRIIRRLDFTQAHRIDSTYDEHAQILRAVIRRRADEANRAAPLAHRSEQGRGAQDHAAPALHRQAERAVT